MPESPRSKQDIALILSAVRALTGAVPPSLISVSVAFNENTIQWQCLLDEQATDEELEILSVAAAEVIADFPAYDLHEWIKRVAPGEKPSLLGNLVYLRYEPSNS